MNYIEQYDPDYVLVLSGDHIYKMDYRQMLDYHITKQADVTISVIEVPWEEASRFGIMNTNDEMQIVEFAEKPAEPKSNLASMGIYIFNWPLLKEYLKIDNDDPHSSHDFGKDIIPLLLRERKRLFAYPFQGYWKDVGTVKSLWEANMDLLDEDNELDLFDRSWRIYSVNPNQPPQYISQEAEVADSLVNEGCVVEGTVKRSVLFQEVYYLSIEFLLGRLLGNNLLNLGVRSVVEEGLRELGIRLEDVEECEADAGLGNGGLGRLAACFLDSLATLNLPGHGHGIRYKHGLFDQKIVDGYQVELPEQWLRNGNVWEIRKEELAVEVRFWGRVEVSEQNGRLVFRHVDSENVMAVPYDVPVIGYGTNTVNTLRLWSAEPAKTFPLYKDVMQYKRETEAISEFLYPDDTHDEGKILRLKQQYFLVAASLGSITRAHRRQHGSLRRLHEYVAIHINDTHPALAIPELMRILLDEEGMSWEEAWHITTHTIAYANHTTLAEALEKWPIRLFQPLLPRIYMIVEEINERFCRELWERYPGDWGRIEQMAIVAHGRQADQASRRPACQRLFPGCRRLL